jgi:hypothetical protein
MPQACVATHSSDASIVVGGRRTQLHAITTFGTPQDVGLQELRIEMSYPMDSATRIFLTETLKRTQPESIER